MITRPKASCKSKLTWCRGSTDRPPTNIQGNLALSRVHPAQASRHRLLQTDVPPHDAKVPGFPGTAVGPGPSCAAAAAVFAATVAGKRCVTLPFAVTTLLLLYIQ